MKIQLSQHKKWVLLMVILNISVSLFHYIHNIVFLPHYHEPAWITPSLIDSVWLIMTPFSCIGYLMLQRNKTQIAYILFYIYCGLSSLVLGHYLVTPIWTLSFTINFIIWLEFIMAVIFAGYIIFLQRYSTNNLSS